MSASILITIIGISSSPSLPLAVSRCSIARETASGNSGSLLTCPRWLAIVSPLHCIKLESKLLLMFTVHQGGCRGEGTSLTERRTREYMRSVGKKEAWGGSQHSQDDAQDRAARFMDDGGGNGRHTVGLKSRDRS